MANSRKSLAQSLGESVVKKFIVDPDGSELSQTLPISRIKVFAQQPRRYFDPEKMAQLIESVREHGILEPLLVRPSSKDTYELIAGERRLRAAEAVGLQEVPVVVRSLDDNQALQISLLENLQREDLNPLEETEGILQLLAIALDIRPDEVASLFYQAYNAKQRGQKLNNNVIVQLETVEKTLSVIGQFTVDSFRINRLPLLKLPEDVLQVLRQGKLEYTKAKAIARLKDSDLRAELLDTAIIENLSLSEIKDRIKATLPTPKTVSPKTVIEDLSRRIVKAKLWESDHKWKKAQTLIAKLEALLEEKA